MRAAGVRTLLALEPLDHLDLEPLAEVAPPDLEPLSVHAYRLRDALPLRSLTPAGAGRVVAAVEDSDRVDLQVEADQPATVIVRDAFARGWTARVNGAPVAIQRGEGRSRAVAVPAGRSRVEMRYLAPGLVAGLSLSAASALILAWLARPVRRGDDARG
jgi:uncharacterized membrane protein YfhO